MSGRERENQGGAGRESTHGPTPKNAMAFKLGKPSPKDGRGGDNIDNDDDDDQEKEERVQQLTWT